MSFLTEIKNFAYDTARKVKNTVVEFVSGENSESKKTNNKKPNSVVSQSNPGNYTDEFVKNQSGGDVAENNKSPQNKETVKSVKQVFENRCIACNANNQIIEQLLNLSELSDEEKIQKYKAMTETINLVISMKKQGRFDEKTDLEAWIAFGVQLKEEAALLPEIKQSELYKKHLQKVDELLDAVQNAKNEVDVERITSNKRREIDLEYNILNEKIKNNKSLSEQEKIQKITQLNKERCLLLKNLFLGSAAIAGDNRILVKAMTIADSSSLSDVIKMARETRKGKQAKIKFSDSIKVKDLADLNKSYNDEYDSMPNSALLGVGVDPLSNDSQGCKLVGQSCSVGLNGGTRKVAPQSMGSAATEATYGKSYDGLKDFENDLVQMRESVENSNDEYNKEIYRAMHSGVSAGTLLNTNLTEEQKIGFLKSWDNDARKFASSYEQVKAGSKELIQQYIQKYGKNNPELVKQLKKLEEKIDEIIAQRNSEENIKNNEIKKLEQEIKSEKKKLETSNKQKVIPEVVSDYDVNPIVRNTSVSKNYAQNTIRSNSGTTSQKANACVNNKHTNDTRNVEEALYEPKNYNTSKIVQNIIKHGYNSVPAGNTRLKITLTNPILNQLYLKDTPKDLKLIQSVNEILPTLNLCPTNVRIFAVEHINLRIKDELIEALKKTSSQDFCTIIDAKQDKEKVEDKANAVV